MRTSLLLLFAILSISRTEAQKLFGPQHFRQLSWLEGSWKGHTGTGVFYEAWRKVNDTVMVNIDIQIKDGDTTYKEGGHLLISGGKVVLSRTWEATRIMPNEIVLENDTIKYSNRIIWLHTREDHWFTILEAPNGTIYYDLQKVPELDAKVDEWIAMMTKKLKS